MGGHREHGTAQQGHEEGVVGGEGVAGPHEHLGLVSVGRGAEPVHPDAGGDDDDLDQPADRIEQHLHHVYLPHSGDPAGEGIQDGDHGEDHGDREVGEVHAEAVEDDLRGIAAASTRMPSAIRR